MMAIIVKFIIYIKSTNLYRKQYSISEQNMSNLLQAKSQAHNKLKKCNKKFFDFHKTEIGYNQKL